MEAGLASTSAISSGFEDTSTEYLSTFEDSITLQLPEVGTPL